MPPRLTIALAVAAAVLCAAVLAAPAPARAAAPAPPRVTVTATGPCPVIRIAAPRARTVRVWRTARPGRWPRRAQFTLRSGRRSVRDTGAVAGRRYWYRAQATTAAGRRSAMSRARSVRAAAAAPAAPAQGAPPPAAPAAPAAVPGAAPLAPATPAAPACAASCPSPAPPAEPTAPPVTTPAPAVPAPAPPAAAPAPLAGSLLAQRFDGPDGLITNEFAYWNPGDPLAVIDPVWSMESGSMLRRGGRAWTGVPDDREPDHCSCTATDSAIFRAWTRQAFGDIALRATVAVNGYTSTPSTPAEAFDGVHLFVRRVSEYELYYISVARRDGGAVIKKKVPGGTENGGTYHTLASRASAGIPAGGSGRVTATVRNLPGGGVRIEASIDGTVILQATDAGTGGPPITAPGAVGMRADNVDAELDDLLVDPAAG